MESKLDIKVIKDNNVEIAAISSEDVLITDVQSALDLFATVDYETGCNRMVIPKSMLCEEFFDLSTKVAGDILQKFINYRIKVAIIGDFSCYPSKSLKAFIYESNRGHDIFFLANLTEAVERLSRV